MKKHALILGLTAVFYAFAFTWVAGQLLMLLDLQIPALALTLAMLIASYGLAAAVAPRIEGANEPGASLIVLLLFMAGYFLFTQVLASFGVGLGFSKFGRFLADLRTWSLTLSAVLVLRFLAPRVMLFVGLAVLALQLQASVALGLFALPIPKIVLQLINLTVAALIARSFCAGDESPADRVRTPQLLWFFSAAAVLAMIFSTQSLGVSWQAVVAWLAYLLCFVLLVSDIEPDDPTHTPSALGANYGQLFTILVALTTIVGALFHVGETVRWKTLALSGSSLGDWLPFLVSLATAITIVVYLQLSMRARPDGPGRKALFWGVLLFFVGLLAGGSIFGASADSSKPFDFLGALVLTALLVVPVMVIAQILMTVGLLRVLFHLDARRG